MNEGQELAIVDTGGRALQPLPPAEAEGATMLERLAKDPAVDINKFERLVAMRREEVADQRRAEFYAAFAAMQGDIPVITKHGEIIVDGKVRSRFARLEDIDRVIKPILQRHGFALMHKQEFGEKLITIVTTLTHRAGHSEVTRFVTAPDTSGSKNAIQAQSSAISYGKRQNTKALVNIAEGAEDDDGNAGGAPGTGSLMTEDHADTLDTMCAGISTTMKKNVLKEYGVDSFEKIPDSQYDSIVHRLRITEKQRSAS